MFVQGCPYLNYFHLCQYCMFFISVWHLVSRGQAGRWLMKVREQGSIYLFDSSSKPQDCSFPAALKFIWLFLAYMTFIITNTQASFNSVTAKVFFYFSSLSARAGVR